MSARETPVDPLYIVGPAALGNLFPVPEQSGQGTVADTKARLPTGTRLDPSHRGHGAARDTSRATSRAAVRRARTAAEPPVSG